MSATKTPWYYLLLLILAGESVFILPFVLPRVFRPTVLAAFEVNNTELGLCFSTYGIVALLSYLYGGTLADRFPPRKLMSVALLLTALGGTVMATFPDYTTLKILYGYWGFTTIFLFWAAMIKATRLWGGTGSQGKAFGFLDGGRGLVGALFGAIGVYIFSNFLSTAEGASAVADSQGGFRQVILVSSGMVATVGILVWFFLRTDKATERAVILDKISIGQIKDVLKLPSVLLLMVIILCGYTGYKVTDVFSLYARDVMHYDEVDSAGVGSLLLFIRPAVGITVGILADRSRTTWWLFLSFAISLTGALLFATGIVMESATLLFVVSTLTVAVGVYAARALYFAVMEAGRIPLVLTGTAVGLISLIGYTPDIFAGPLMGYFLDGSPGIKGHQGVFWVVVAFSIIGLAASWRYHRLYARD